MCSNIRAFPPSPAALLGAMTGFKVKSNGNNSSNDRSKSISNSNCRSKRNDCSNCSNQLQQPHQQHTHTHTHKQQ